MKKNDYFITAILGLLAVFVWLRDTAWMKTLDDTLPILIALPLFAWLGSPWQWLSTPPIYSRKLLILGVCLFTIGIGLNATLILTIGWLTLLITWLSARLPKKALPRVYKLLIFPLMAFPWISLDFDRVGWWFRLSGAWVTEHFFSWLNFAVMREGTLLSINGIPVSIEVACAGLNTLQSMLISGGLVAFILLENTARFWLSLPIIVIIAWMANTVRIIVICWLALLISPEFVMGPFHTWGGWGVLMLMFALCWLVLSWLEPKGKSCA